ncbi:EspA/EspE family type VII secretion system effector [Mycobacterium sp. 050134]|uniref:EspA/EspE family type VII secretion system effector n=1 Tax=Mycobacterium sp. 050134 TaxID=3096111 RepID=UPI002ED78F55
MVVPLLVEAANVAANLAGFGQQFGNLARTGELSGPYLAAGATGLAGDLGGFTFSGRRLITTYSDWADARGYRRHRNPATKGTGILLRTLAIVDVLELSTGFEVPYEGDSLVAGSVQLTALYEQLVKALPDDRWVSSASGAYAEQVVARQLVVRAAANLDLELADLVSAHAELVTYMRLSFGVLKDLLAGALILEELIMITPAAGGEPAAKVFAAVVSTIALALAMGFICYLVTESQLLTDEIDAIKTQYVGLAGRLMDEISPLQSAQAGDSSSITRHSTSSSASAGATTSRSASIVRGPARPSARFSAAEAAPGTAQPTIVQTMQMSVHAELSGPVVLASAERPSTARGRLGDSTVRTGVRAKLGTDDHDDVGADEAAPMGVAPAASAPIRGAAFATAGPAPLARSTPVRE